MICILSNSQAAAARVYLGAGILFCLMLPGCQSSRVGLPIGTSCSSHSFCGEEMACRKGKCARLCQADAECPETMHCLSYTCVKSADIQSKQESEVMPDLVALELRAMRAELERLNTKIDALGQDCRVPKK